MNYPKNFDFNKKSYLSLIYDNLPAYETNEKIKKLLYSLVDVLGFDGEEVLNELIQLVIDYVITSIANQKCVKIILDK